MTAVIIAGGQSRRMKRDKAFLEIGGKMLIERVLDVNLIRTRYLSEHVIRQFDPSLESFLNVNTLEELRAARRECEDIP